MKVNGGMASPVSEFLRLTPVSRFNSVEGFAVLCLRRFYGLTPVSRFKVSRYAVSKFLV